MTKLEDLLNYKLTLDKETNEDILINILNKFDAELTNFSIEDFKNSKIGKSLMLLSEKKNKALQNKALSLIDKMKNALKNEKAKESKQEIIKNDKANTNTTKSDKNFKENYKATLSSLNEKESIPIRKNVKVLLFDALLQKEECSYDKLQYIKEFTKKIEETLYINLFMGDDKGGKYLQRAKSIVFNLGVSDYINIIKERN